MENHQKPAFGFVQNRVPWIVAGAALLLYIVTLNGWARLDSLLSLSAAGGWSLYVTVRAPLLHLIAVPFRILPSGLQAPALNLLTAVMAALALALLARSVALLPFDRTRETRLRERSEYSLLSIPMAWLPVVLACVLAGLQLSFWEHATVFTGEMLDLLLFAYVLRCLLEFRIDRRQVWLTKMAFVYGLAVANNYAMIAFFPGFLVALAWIKSWEFLNPTFLLRTLAAGVAGLLLYLYLPLVNVLGGDQMGTFGQHVRAVLGSQLAALRSVPPYVILVLSFTSILPVLLLSIPWSSDNPSTSAAGASIIRFLVRALQIILVAACLSVFFDTRWSPRQLGAVFGAVFLPLYYLSALSMGYFAGYFLLMTVPAKGRGWPQAPSLLERLGKTGPAFAALVLVATLVLLGGRNWQPVAAANTPALAKIADRMVEVLPAQGACVLSDEVEDLLLLEARWRHTRGVPPHVFVYANWLEFVKYHERLARQYPGRWPAIPDLAQMPEPLNPGLLTAMLGNLALTNAVYFINPSFGTYFEVLRLVPNGPIYRALTIPLDRIMPAPLTQDDLAAAQQFWEATAPSIEPLVACTDSSLANAFLKGFYGRALNHWGVTLQRHGDVAGAARWFDLAARLSPDNTPARVNRAYNAELRHALEPGEKPSDSIEVSVGQWDRFLRAFGPFDHPRWSLETGASFARAGFYRQALIEFERVSALSPTNTVVPLWRDNMAVMTRLRLGDTAAAEKQALALQEAFPREEIAFEALTQVYLATGRVTNALANVERQLALNSTNANAMLNKAAFHMQLQEFPQAITTLDALLALQPQNQAALLNRAIAQLQDNRLDKAQQDYLLLLKTAPEAPVVHYGLAEIDYRQTNYTAALAHYDKYLKFAPVGTDEYKAVQQRVQELRQSIRGR
ncbi:MAG: tetratricopeptide repeat protein [Verrucomicrobia bacterium]|jgi:tetratricopeptide (TPR) repeat protein|nr:tetratricopeptide repeat protein [Verrucomicrobiota bacterium]OQC66045.1 MAG: lipoprotein NlpI [Verrucomicrobia bacterium ADurb.Bin006]MDI9379952.1 tetratricopeptide repeat protein [Verrucomicrobiota bacterium]NMD19568.1 tetratricopeptide repeat protein [Verrucomicrobiota bacterium]HOA62913.1 tetratricopeptide repeat protein [Verrucomicrobiota bacterium]